MKINISKRKYTIDFTNSFKKQYKKIKKQGKDINKLIIIIETLASGKKLDSKYSDHSLLKDKTYKNYRECHIEPDWLLIYKIKKDRLVLVLFATGSHSELFKK